MVQVWLFWKSIAWNKKTLQEESSQWSIQVPISKVQRDQKHGKLNLEHIYCIANSQHEQLHKMKRSPSPKLSWILISAPNLFFKNQIPLIEIEYSTLNDHFYNVHPSKGINASSVRVTKTSPFRKFFDEQKLKKENNAFSEINWRQIMIL